MVSYIFIIFIILLIWNYRLYLYYTEHMVISNIDGNSYSVKKKFKDHQMASDILARLNAINTKVIDHMKHKYANTSRAEDVEFLVENYNGDVLSEHIPRTTVNTSYVLNKGDMIKLCLRDPNTGDFHKFQTLVFVNLHELSHLLDREYGHNIGFWRGFKTILQEAAEIGVYTPINYKYHPEKYCGLTITSNPYYNQYN